MEQLLITAADLRKYRPLSDKIEDTRIGPFILEAQQVDLKPILNDGFYYWITKNINDAGVQELIKGKEYEYQDVEYRFDGIEPVLAYYTIVRFIQSNPLNAVRFGIVQKLGENSQPVDPAMIQAEVKSLRSAAIQFQTGLITYLDRMKDDYPLWNNGGRDNNKGRKNAFNFFRGT